MTILEKIVVAKKEEVARLKSAEPLSELKDKLKDIPQALDFKKAISTLPCSIIAEVKGRSPSKGTLKENLDPFAVAGLYEENGAAAISVLTDEEFFGGSRVYLSGIRKRVSLPLLRKDFIIDPYQIYETPLIGGDALLLIAGILESARLQDYIGLARSLGLYPLVEVHSLEELEKSLAAGAEIIGINNRDLKTFAVDLKTSGDLAPAVPKDRIVVSESGIRGRADIDFLMKAGIHAFLIGEVLMTAPDIAAKLKELLSGC
jgi:indole-3-glycerol phosphate synthase